MEKHREQKRKDVTPGWVNNSQHQQQAGSSTANPGRNNRPRSQKEPEPAHENRTAHGKVNEPPPNKTAHKCAEFLCLFHFLSKFELKLGILVQEKTTKKPNLNSEANYEELQD